MDFKNDACNVRVKAGTHQPSTSSLMDWFDVVVCKGQIELEMLTKKQ